LLAKIGAYFHDIGKLNDPPTFVENQTGDVGNIHETLTARESAKRVKKHGRWRCARQSAGLAAAHH